jgi:hypothetical protein
MIECVRYLPRVIAVGAMWAGMQSAEEAGVPIERSFSVG